jgi:hypothetical protein
MAFLKRSIGLSDEAKVCEQCAHRSLVAELHCHTVCPLCHAPFAASESAEENIM